MTEQELNFDLMAVSFSITGAIVGVWLLRWFLWIAGYILYLLFRRGRG